MTDLKGCQGVGVGGSVTEIQGISSQCPDVLVPSFSGHYYLVV